MEVVVYAGKLDNKKWIMLNCHSKFTARSNVCWKQKNKIYKTVFLSHLMYSLYWSFQMSSPQRLSLSSRSFWTTLLGTWCGCQGVLCRVRSCSQWPWWETSSSTYSMILGFCYLKEGRKGMRVVSCYILYSLEAFLWAGSHVHYLFYLFILLFILFQKQVVIVEQLPCAVKIMLHEDNGTVIVITSSELWLLQGWRLLQSFKLV